MTDNMISKREIEEAIASLAQPDIVVQRVTSDGVPWGKKIAVYKKNGDNIPNKELFTISSRTVYDALLAVRSFGMNYNGEEYEIYGKNKIQWNKAFSLYSACASLADSEDVFYAKLFYIFPNLVKVKTRMFFDRIFCKTK